MDNADDVALLPLGQRLALRNIVPLRQAAAAAGRGGVLGDKDGVTAHGGLLTVIDRKRGGKALRHEV